MLRTAACLTTVLVLSTAAMTAPAQAQQSPAASSATTVLSSHPSAKLPHADSDFLKEAAHNGHAEVEGSKLALSKATSPEVKAFAQQMVEAHGKAGEELNALAASKGIILSDGPSIAQRAKLKLLSARQGHSFDQHYTDSLGIKAHQDTVKLFQKASDEAKDPDVKAFAIKTLPVLQHHLDLSRDLYATVHQGDPKKR